MNKMESSGWESTVSRGKEIRYLLFFDLDLTRIKQWIYRTHGEASLPRTKS